MAADKINPAALMTTITVPGGSVIKLCIPETMQQQLINVLCQFPTT